ncbi:MAG: hypothetical protein AB7K09_08670 [Planctomycetota bacterium]
MLAPLASPLAAQDPPAQPAQPAGDNGLAATMPGSTVLYAEWPDVQAANALFSTPVPEGDAAAKRRRADVERFLNESNAGTATLLGMNKEEADAFRTGTVSVGAGLLDAGSDFVRVLLVVRHNKADAVAAAFDRLVRETPSRASKWVDGDAKGWKIEVPERLEMLDRTGLLDGMPGQDPWSMLLSVTGNSVHVARKGDLLLFCNHPPELKAALTRKREESLAGMKSFVQEVGADHRKANEFVFADMRNVHDAIERALDNRGRAGLDRVNGLLQLQKMIAFSGHSSTTATGVRSQARLALDQHETFKSIRMTPGPLDLASKLPASALGAFVFSVPDPPDACTRIIEFIRRVIIAGEGDVESFDMELERTNKDFGVPALKEMFRAVGDEGAYVFLPPSPPPEPDESNPWSFYYNDSSPGAAFVFTVKDEAGFDDAWQRVLQSEQMGRQLREAKPEDIDGVQAFIQQEDWGTSWARAGKFFVLAPSRDAMRMMLGALTDKTGKQTLAQAPGFKEFRATYPGKLSKFLFGQFGLIARMLSYGETAVTDEFARLGDGAWVGISTEETDHLDLRLNLYAPDFGPRLEMAVSMAYEQMRLQGCQNNLRLLGEAIRDSAINRGEYPESIDALVKAGQFSLEEHGASPVEVYAAETAGKSADEIKQIRSYEYMKPVHPEKIDSEVDQWGPPDNCVMLAWTARPLYHGGRHVLMSNGSVHWVSEEHFTHLKQLAARGITQAELDEEWNKQAEERRRAEEDKEKRGN